MNVTAIEIYPDAVAAALQKFRESGPIVGSARALVAAYEVAKSAGIPQDEAADLALKAKTAALNSYV